MVQNLFFIGILFMILGGIMEGTFSFPLKFTPKWAWENTWGAGSFLALILLPWPLALITIPNISEVYASVPVSVIILALFFGAGWGTGGIFFGKGLAALGFSIGTALIMGLIAIGGSIIPLAMNHPEKLLKLPGLVLIMGIIVMIIGLFICSKAGMMKNKVQNTSDEKANEGFRKVTFRKGLIYCIAAGLLSALVNFGFIYGTDISEAAIKFGTKPAHAGNSILALVFSANYLVNTAYCAYLIYKNKTFKNFSLKGTTKYWVMALFMGVIWPGGIVVYGIGITMISDLGAYLGFPAMLIFSIIAGNIFGILTGEWAGVTAKPKRIMTLGISVLFIATIILGMSMNLV